jgi:hypothetical protein
MARWTFALLALSAAAGQFAVQAAPAGSLKCNLARLKVVNNLKAASKLVDQMVDDTVDAQDADVHTAITDAQTGLDDATTAVQGIADALKAKQAPPNELRDQALAGLNAAKTALTQFASSDSTDSKSVTKAQKKIDDALAAGQQVVDSCGGGADSSASDTTGAATNGTATDAATTSGTAAKRQIGGIACNIARLQTVTSLAKSSKAVKKLAAAAANDATAADAATQATSGLGDAKAGIAKIAATLLTGGKAPADARTQVENGLNAAKTALAAAANSTDPAVVDAVTAASNAVDSTITAGGKVVANCK